MAEFSPFDAHRYLATCNAPPPKTQHEQDMRNAAFEYERMQRRVGTFEEDKLRAEISALLRERSTLTAALATGG